MKSKNFKNKPVTHNNIVSFLFKLLLLIQMITLTYSCSESPTEQKKDPPTIGIVSISPYDSPVWHPDGDLIGFNYKPLDSIAYDLQKFNHDSIGFWLINIDGTNQHRVLSFKLQTPSWSPDGKWIAFVNGAQIYKMPFANGEFDTTNIIQLTTTGKNFFPSWSPDGKWIAFDSNNDSYTGGYHIWKMDNYGYGKSLVVGGRMCSWSNDSKWIYYVGLHNEIYKIHINDTTEVIQITHLNDNNIYASDNRYPSLSSNNTLAFSSSDNSENLPQLFVMNLTTKETVQLTNDGIYGEFSWSPDGNKIVYTKHDYHKWDYKNGVLWIIDIYTGYKKQLTFNTTK